MKIGKNNNVPIERTIYLRVDDGFKRSESTRK